MKRGGNSHITYILSIFLSFLVLSSIVFAVGGNTSSDDSGNVTIKQMTKLIDFVFDAFGFSAHLVLDNDSALDNQTLHFYDDYTYLSSDVTDKSGFASVNYSPLPGTYNLSIFFNGTDNLFPVSISQDVIVPVVTNSEVTENNTVLINSTIPCVNLSDLNVTDLETYCYGLNTVDSILCNNDSSLCNIFEDNIYLNIDNSTDLVNITISGSSVQNPTDVGVSVSGTNIVTIKNNDYMTTSMTYNLILVSTAEDTSVIGVGWIYINLTSDDNLSFAKLQWSNSSGLTNISMSNSSMTHWYVNMTGLSDGIYNYTIWIENTTGATDQSELRIVTIDTINPNIYFDSPTPINNDNISENYTYINITTIDTNNITAFIDWNNSLVGWWVFNDENDFTDYSSYSNDGTNYGSTYTSAGKFGGARTFNGFNVHVDVPYNSNLDMTEAITLEAWIHKNKYIFNSSIWDYRKLITLTPTTTISDYKLKVELTPTNFDYSKAQLDGADIRFLDSVNNMLSYWIENWNSTGTSTVIVNVPVSGTSTIYMYYGNAEAVSMSSNRADMISYKTYTFADSLNTAAYHGKDLETSVPVAVDRATWSVPATEFSSENYDTIALSNDMRVSSSAGVGLTQQVVHDFVFKIDENIGGIYSINVSWEGYGSKGIELEADNDLRMYLLDRNTTSFELKDSKLDNSCSGINDCEMIFALNGTDINLSNYLNETGHIRFLVQKYENMKLPLGESCSSDNECASNACNVTCFDPWSYKTQCSGIDIYYQDAGTYAWASPWTQGCLNGGRWPTRDELYCIYTNRASLGYFQSNYHWSNTESTSTRAYALIFSNGIWSSSYKTVGNGVRCVRSKLALGESCTADIECASDLCSSNLCKLALGESCTADTECASDLCSSNLCKLAPGESCTADIECASNFCDVTCSDPWGYNTQCVGIDIYYKDVSSSQQQWKTSDTNCNIPQCGLDGGQDGDDLVDPVANPGVDFSSYPAQNLCKSISGRLPTKNELNCISTNKASLGSFRSHYYWSSTEYSSTSAWMQYIVIGVVYNEPKDYNGAYVRCVRGQ